MNMTTTTNPQFTAEVKNGQHFLYNRNVFIGAWSDAYEFELFCGNRGIVVEVAA